MRMMDAPDAYRQTHTYRLDKHCLPAAAAVTVIVIVFRCRSSSWDLSPALLAVYVCPLPRRHTRLRSGWTYFKQILHFARARASAFRALTGKVCFTHSTLSWSLKIYAHDGVLYVCFVCVLCLLVLSATFSRNVFSISYSINAIEYAMHSISAAHLCLVCIELKSRRSKLAAHTAHTLVYVVWQRRWCWCCWLVVVAMYTVLQQTKSIPFALCRKPLTGSTGFAYGTDLSMQYICKQKNAHIYVLFMPIVLESFDACACVLYSQQSCALDVCA